MSLCFLSSARERKLFLHRLNFRFILPAADYTPPYSEGLFCKPDDIKYSRKIRSNGSDFFDKATTRFVGRNFYPNVDDIWFSRNQSQTAGSTLNWHPLGCQYANANRHPSNSGKSFFEGADRQDGFSP